MILRSRASITTRQLDQVQPGQGLHHLAPGGALRRRRAAAAPPPGRRARSEMHITCITCSNTSATARRARSFPGSPPPRGRAVERGDPANRSAQPAWLLGLEQILQALHPVALEAATPALRQDVTSVTPHRIHRVRQAPPRRDAGHDLCSLAISGSWTLPRHEGSSLWLKAILPGTGHRKGGGSVRQRGYLRFEIALDAGLPPSPPPNLLPDTAAEQSTAGTTQVDMELAA